MEIKRQLKKLKNLKENFKSFKFEKKNGRTK